MSKYTEMQSAAKAARKAGFEFKNRCVQNMDKLIRGFLGYCQIPDSACAFMPLDQEPEPEKRYTLPGAMHYNENDGFWHLGMMVEIDPLHAIVLEFCLTEQNGKVVVKGGEGGALSPLDLGHQNQCNAFYDEIAAQIVAIISEPVYGESRAISRIGF